MGNVHLALLFFCLGALFLTSEGQRVHEQFAASTFYTKNETAVDPEKATIPNRYERGYPDSKHLYDPVTGKYASNETASEKLTTPEGGRYEHGYYNESGWDKPSETDTIPVVKSYKSTYTTVEKDAAGVFDRYPLGYPKKPSPSYTGPSLGLAKTMDDMHRYEGGYYGKAKEYLKGTNEQQHQSFSTAKLPTEGDYNPSNRYPGGYYAGARYGENPTYETAKRTTQYGSSYEGNFNTMPYPATGVPFVATGAGCRTSYWAKDVGIWPAFFTAQSTLGDAFGTKATEVYGQTTMLQALLTYKTGDSYSEMARCACTSLLNSYERGAFPLSHIKVIEKFTAALISKDAAQAQALEFEKYNVESISQGQACGEN